MLKSHLLKHTVFFNLCYRKFLWQSFPKNDLKRFLVFVIIWMYQQYLLDLDLKKAFEENLMSLPIIGGYFL